MAMPKSQGAIIAPLACNLLRDKLRDLDREINDAKASLDAATALVAQKVQLLSELDVRRKALSDELDRIAPPDYDAGAQQGTDAAAAYLQPGPATPPYPLGYRRPWHRDPVAPRAPGSATPKWRGDDDL